MRILVAGDRGYIGAVMVPFLVGAGHQVDGLDVGWYEGCDLGPSPEAVGDRLPLDMREVRHGTSPATTRWSAWQPSRTTLWVI